MKVNRGRNGGQGMKRGVTHTLYSLSSNNIEGVFKMGTIALFLKQLRILKLNCLLEIIMLIY